MGLRIIDNHNDRKRSRASGKWDGFLNEFAILTAQLIIVGQYNTSAQTNAVERFAHGLKQLEVDTMATIGGT